jgi:hypothetical protein
MADTAIDLEFADGRYHFWLPLPQVVELERKTGDTSILVIEERLRGAIGVEETEGGEPRFVFLGGGAAMVGDVRETLRLGLIGGGSGLVDGEEVEVGPNTARRLVDAYAYPARPLAEGVVLAWRILHAAIHGVQLKKKPEPVTPEQTSDQTSETPSESPFEKGS